jgi:Mn2+/Fe2+ NRAMP family transporter
VICEGLGFEAGLDNKLKEAPVFYSLYTMLIVVGAGIILIPKAPLFKILVLSQVANGVWLPVVLIFILLLINRKDLMGEHTNSWGFNIVAWSMSIIMIVLTLVLVYAAIFAPSAAGITGFLMHPFRSFVPLWNGLHRVLSLA